ncbi:hypothetical protein V8C86DRAFT_2583355 [Haematococcus lacustris]
MAALGAAYRLSPAVLCPNPLPRPGSEQPRQPLPAPCSPQHLPAAMRSNAEPQRGGSQAAGLRPLDKPPPWTHGTTVHPHPLPAVMTAEPQVSPPGHTSASCGVQTAGMSRSVAGDAAEVVWALDGALPPDLLALMQRALGPASPFWLQHGYQSDGSTPYFSYCHKLPAWEAAAALAEAGGHNLPPCACDEKGQQQQQQQQGVAEHGRCSQSHPTQTSPASSVAGNTLDSVIAVIWAHAGRLFPAAQAARWAEWWCHCRPHTAGHQLHFDSANEGNEGRQGAVSNPLVSSVLYLTDAVGGPTLVTPQRFMQTRMAQHGWLVAPRVNRLTVFDGAVLHGVIPGSGVCHAGCDPLGCESEGGQQHSVKENPSHHTTALQATRLQRVTFMVAFWQDLRVRPGHGPGAARPFPTLLKNSLPLPAPTRTLMPCADSFPHKEVVAKAEGISSSPSAWPHLFESNCQQPTSSGMVQQPEGRAEGPGTAPVSQAAAGTGNGGPQGAKPRAWALSEAARVEPYMVTPIWCDVVDPQPDSTPPCKQQLKELGPGQVGARHRRSIAELEVLGVLPSYDDCFQF